MARDAGAHGIDVACVECNASFVAVAGTVFAVEELVQLMFVERILAPCTIKALP
jgi:hypothetical protein